MTSAWANYFDGMFTPEPNTGCFIWLGRTGGVPGGEPVPYGAIRHGRRGVTMLAHRLSYRLATGTDPADLFVCHRCDFPICVNPAHLFLGDHSANMRDMVSKRRHPVTKRPGLHRGERNPNSKLKLEDVTQIRARRLAGARRMDLAKEFGVTEQSIYFICKGITWRPAGGA